MATFDTRPSPSHTTPLANIITAPVFANLRPASSTPKLGKDGKPVHDKDGNPVTVESPGVFARRYAATLKSTLDFGNHRDVNVKNIFYEVGMANFNLNCLASVCGGLNRIDASYPVPSSLADGFVGYARRHGNFSGDFQYANLAGVVERLARALGCSSNYSVSSSSIAGGAQIQVHTLGTVFSPASASANSVFIPRLVETITTPGVFAVIAAAVAGEGSSIVTDCVEVDASSRAAIVPSTPAASTPAAIVDALHLLGANFAACNVGDLFAYAVTRGIHQAVSVVGHSDEGGLVRDLLRAGGFSAPFGAIHFGLTNYIGLPALTSASAGHNSGYVDSVALGTAGLVAHCDPGMYIGSAWYPTVIDASQRGSVVGASGRAGGAVTDNHDALAAIQDLAASFGASYMAGLTKLFCFAECSGRAASHFSAVVATIHKPTRHMGFATLAPWFWIEPTSLIASDFLGTDAELYGSGSLVTAHRSRTIPSFEAGSFVGQPSIVKSCGTVRLRSARTSGLIVHLQGRRGDGLANVIPRQLDPESILLPGAGDSIYDRLFSETDVGGYLWTRGQSSLPAPAEFLNLGGTMTLEFQHMDCSQGAPEPADMPTPEACLYGDVVFEVSSPMGLQGGATNSETRDASRARTIASRALQAVRLRRFTGETATVQAVTISATRPSLDAVPAVSVTVGDRSGPSVQAKAPPVTVAPVPDKAAGTTRTGTLPATLSLGSQTGPTVAHPSTTASSGSTKTVLQPESAPSDNSGGRLNE